MKEMQDSQKTIAVESQVDRERIAAIEKVNDARYEERVLSELSANRRGIRNRLLLVGVIFVAGATALMANIKSPDSKQLAKTEAQEVRLRQKEIKKIVEEALKSEKKKKKEKSKTSVDVEDESVVMAETMLKKGDLMSRYLRDSEKKSWARSIVEQMEAANIPVNRQNLMIVISTIDHESGFNEIGVVNSPEGILDRKINEFRRENPKIYSLMQDRVSRLRGMALQFIRDRRAKNLAQSHKNGKNNGDFTEKDVNLAIDYAMSLYDSEVPDVVKPLFPKDHMNKFRPKTSGCMQINVRKAVSLAQSVDMETLSEEEMRETLNTRDGGLHYGMIYLKKILDAHSKHGKVMSPNEIKYVFADYNMGAFTTRNAAIQSNLNALGQKITVDGDLMMYNKDGTVSGRRSDTEIAIRKVLAVAGIKIDDLEVHVDLLLEKSENFESTKTFRGLMKVFADHGLQTTDVIPANIAPEGFIKFGTNGLSGAKYAEGSYRRYRNLENTMASVDKTVKNKEMPKKQTRKKNKPTPQRNLWFK